MKVINVSYPNLNKIKAQPIVVAIGYFDGVHLGHQQVIQTAKRMAEQLGVSLAVMTFQPHPREVLQPSLSLKYLTPLPTKITILEQYGVDQLYVIQFNQQFANLSADDFVENILIPLNVKGTVTGFNFHFGKNQSGKAEDLEELSQGRFETATVPAVVRENISVSSTWIRQLLVEGKVDQVTKLLGRYYQFWGRVEQGDRRGRLLGFPTANLALPEPFFIPKRGVYIVRCSFGSEWAYGLMNIGVRPTFHSQEPTEKVEVHLFARELDLYDKILSVEVLHFLRTEQKFASGDALIKQIKQDQLQAEKWLSMSQLFT